MNARQSQLALIQLQAKGKLYSPTILSSPVNKFQVPKKREVKDQEKEMLRQQVILAEANADKIAVAYEELEV